MGILEKILWDENGCCPEAIQVKMPAQQIVPRQPGLLQQGREDYLPET